MHNGFKKTTISEPYIESGITLDAKLNGYRLRNGKRDIVVSFTEDELW